MFKKVVPQTMLIRLAYTSGLARQLAASYIRYKVRYLDYLYMQHDNHSNLVHLPTFTQSLLYWHRERKSLLLQPTTRDPTLFLTYNYPFSCSGDSMFPLKKRRRAKEIPVFADTKYRVS